MTNNSTTSINYKKVGIMGLDKISMIVIIGMSFMFHYFSGMLFAIIIAAFSVLYVLSKPIVVGKQSWIVFLWLPAIFAIYISFLRSNRSLESLMDVIILSFGVLIVIFCSQDDKLYDQCIKLIIVFGLYFALGIFIQIFLPNTYRTILQWLPGVSDIEIIKFEGYNRGFSTNPGFAAGYISAGILALLSHMKTNRDRKTLNSLSGLFLLVGLFFTGKRGTVIFLIMAIGICYIIPNKGIVKIKKYCKVILVSTFTLLVFILIQDILVSIPFMSRIIDTIRGLSDGEDVSSLRFGLYSWALKLFSENPLIGIGWGNFRTTVVGNVSLITSLEVHNIYLQLLSETGIIGFICIVTPFAVFWKAAKDSYCQCLAGDNTKSTRWKQIVFFSFVYQTFFLLYGLTENPFYDQHYQIIYMFSCSIVIAYKLNFAHSKSRNSDGVILANNR